jgi:hypothetical protein
VNFNFHQPLKNINFSANSMFAFIMFHDEKKLFLPQFNDLFNIMTCEKLINHSWSSHPIFLTSLTVPSKPQNVRVLNVTATSIKITWHEPERPNGVIHAYRVYYMFLNQTLLHLPMLKNDANIGPPFHYKLINLSEFIFGISL